MVLPEEDIKRAAGDCELCGRSGVLLTRHHLIPKTRHRNKRARRSFDRREMIGRVAYVCRPCHNHIHNLFTEKELERTYNSIETLRNNEELLRFVEWVQKKPAGFKPASRKLRRT